MNSNHTPDLIELKVLGISYSQNQSDAFALILAQQGGPVRIPVIIGATEAQSIAMCMENIDTPRPMTHDLMVNLTRAFGIGIRRVFIYKFEDGVFSSEITFFDTDREVTADARTSDAVNLALRTGAPIYTTRAVMEETGFVMETDKTAEEDAVEEASTPEPRLPDEEKYTVEELERSLSRHIEREEYEEAARINAILRRKKGEDAGDADTNNE